MHLAQLNVGRLVDDPDSDTVREFMDALEPINRLGELSPGFVWQLRDDDGPGSTGQRFPGHEDDPRFIINLTVWEDVESLRHYTTRSGHAMYLKRRREWFEKPAQATTVLWWVEDGHRPDLREAAERLARIRSDGPTPHAFDFTTVFPPG